jgi:hypothetical protein
LAGVLFEAYIFIMISIADIATAIEAARTYALPGREAVAVTDVVFQLRELNNNEQ